MEELIINQEYRIIEDTVIVVIGGIITAVEIVAILLDIEVIGGLIIAIIGRGMIVNIGGKYL